MTLALAIAVPTFDTDATSINYGLFDLSPHVERSEPVLRLAMLAPGPRDAASISESDVGVAPPAAAETEEQVNVPIARVCEALAQAASEQGLPVGFFARLLWQESRFDQWARSGAGALGVAQFMPLTAAEYGVQNPFDPLQSVAASARFLRELRDQFGNLGLAAAAYNAGGGRLRKWLNGQIALPEETRNYVQIVTGHPVARWTVQKPLQVSFALPGRAPCDGIDGLSRNAETRQHDVQLTELSRDLIEAAEVARRARIAAERAAARKKMLAAKAAKSRRFAAARKHHTQVASAK